MNDDVRMATLDPSNIATVISTYRTMRQCGDSVRMAATHTAGIYAGTVAHTIANAERIPPVDMLAKFVIADEFVRQSNGLAVRMHEARMRRVLATGAQR